MEARFHAHRLTSFTLLNDELVGGSTTEYGGLAVRVILEGSMGFASTSKLTRESAASALSRAISIARASGRGVKRKISLSEEALGRASYKVLARKNFSDIALEDKVSMVREYSGLISSDDIKISSKTLGYGENIEYKFVVNSDGGRVESLTPRVTVFYNIAASNGSRRANKWGHVAGSGGLEILEEQRLTEAIAEDLESLKVSLTKAGPPPKGVMDVILSPEIVGLALHESIGHPSEADRVLGREAAQAGLSYRIDLEGQIGSSAVTVIDDPTIPGSYGFYLYDDETVPARPRKLIDKGYLAELLHNRETAARYGVKSNAAARARDYRSEPIVRMANTYLQPGDYTFEELIEDVKEGVYVKTYMEWNIDEFRLVARYVGLEAYMVKQGRLAEPVRDVLLQIPSREFYSKIDAVGRDLRMYAGLCGKGEPPQPLPVWMGGPHVRLRGVRVG